MTATFDELVSVDTEHLLGAVTTKGLVLLRCLGEKVTMIGQLTPDQARNIAMHLFESAARAEYEEDLWRGSKRHDVSDEAIGALLNIVREGEFHRHTTKETPPDD